MRALRNAAALARHYDAVLEVLHVYQVPAHIQPGLLVWAATGPRPLWELAEEQARAELESILSKVLAEHEVRVESIVEAGDPAHSIVEIARRRGADLVVMGTHGRTGARRVALGSVAERVVRSCLCAVLVVPAAATTDLDSDEKPPPVLGPEGAKQ
jgi:nucleotide-binding universal stress UspA family protein